MPCSRVADNVAKVVPEDYANSMPGLLAPFSLLARESPVEVGGRTDQSEVS